MKRHIIPAIAILVASVSGGAAFGQDSAIGQETPPDLGSISREVRVRVVQPRPAVDRPLVTPAEAAPGEGMGRMGRSRSVLSEACPPLETSGGDDWASKCEAMLDCCGGFECGGIFNRCGRVLDRCGAIFDRCGGVLAGGTATFDVEFTFLRYAQEGGVMDLAGSPGQFGLDLAPRFELGYELADGLGTRFRYWFYDEDTRSAANNVIAVDADYFDMEIFQRLGVGCNTDLEISGGFRFLEFGQSSGNAAMPAAATFKTDAFGGIVAIQSRTQVLRGALYARARWGILQGDATVTSFTPGPMVVPSTANDSTIQQLELAIGYEIARCTDWGLLTLRLGAEWQQWANVAIADTTFLGINDKMEDVSFAGIVFGVGFER